MALREIIRIDEELCDGCGDCVPACAEGAIAIVDGKARLVSETYCDGMGACLGHCPRGALTMEQVDAQQFDPEAVERHLARTAAATEPAPPAQVASHLASPPLLPTCPGSRPMAWDAAPKSAAGSGPAVAPSQSALRQWPVQLHLLAPSAPWLAERELLLAADCVAYAMGDFHDRFLAGRTLAIACPKLDSEQQRYLDKLAAMIDEGGIGALTVAVMEVPCCSGLVRLALEAARRARRKVPVRRLVVGVRGDVLADDALAA